MSKRVVMNLLADRPVAYHPDIARVAGGVKAGIFLSQLLYWSDKGKRQDGYVWKTQQEWEAETALTRKEQESARKELKNRGILHEKLQGIPAKLYYKIDTDVLYKLLDDLYVQTSMSQTGILDSDFGTYSDVQDGQTITESTSKNTEESTTVRGGVEISEVYECYHNNMGELNKIMSDGIEDWFNDVGGQWLLDAIVIAVKANKKSWSYVEGILKRWKRDGRNERQTYQNGKANDAVGGYYV